MTWSRVRIVLERFERYGWTLCWVVGPACVLAASALVAYSDVPRIIRVSVGLGCSGVLAFMGGSVAMRMQVSELAKKVAVLECALSQPRLLAGRGVADHGGHASATIIDR